MNPYLFPQQWPEGIEPPEQHLYRARRHLQEMEFWKDQLQTQDNGPSTRWKENELRKAEESFRINLELARMNRSINGMSASRTPRSSDMAQAYPTMASFTEEIQKLNDAFTRMKSGRKE